MSSGQPVTALEQKFISQSPEDLKEAVQFILSHSAGKKIKVIAVYGPLGAGKTTLIKAICRQLGTSDLLSSPSFGILNEYRLADGSPVYHFDFYRIGSDSEVYDLGYEQFFYSGHYCFVEWPEKIPDLLPAGTLKVYMEWSGTQRLITIQHYE